MQARPSLASVNQLADQLLGLYLTVLAVGSQHLLSMKVITCPVQCQNRAMLAFQVDVSHVLEAWRSNPEDPSREAFDTVLDTGRKLRRSWQSCLEMPLWSS